ncbi:unnamed protein product [Arctogadus glacialis]
MSFPFVLIWATQMLFSKTQGEVTTVANVNAVPGLPFTLSCNVSTATGERVRQVRWLDPGGQVLTAYEPGDPPAVSLGRPDVRLSPGLPHAASAVTVATAGPAHQGCYVCEFHVYPGGRQQGRTCLTLTATVLLEGGGMALSGGVARLRCLYSGDPAGVRQVLWSRRGRGGGGDPTPLGSYSGGGGALVGAALGGRGQLSASPGESRLTLQPVGPQDEACYTCQLHTFPQGRLQGSTCLVVYEPALTETTPEELTPTEAKKYEISDKIRFCSNPVGLLDQRFYNPVGLLDQRFYNPVGLLDQRSYNPVGLLDQRFYNPVGLLDQRFYNPVGLLDQRFYNPVGLLDQRSYNPVGLLDQRSYNPVGLLDQRSYNPVGLLDQRFYNPVGLLDQRSYNPVGLLDQRSYNPVGLLDHGVTRVV